MKLLTAVIGSHMHAMQRHDSDVDMREVTVSPLRTMLDPFTEEKIRTHTANGDDHVIYELRSFLRLLGKGSPSIIDIVYSPLVTTYGLVAEQLIRDKRKFIDAEAARNNCLGYCKGMRHNAVKGERPHKSLKSALFTTDVVLSFLQGHDYDPMKWDSRVLVREVAGSANELPILDDLVCMGMHALESVKTTNEFDIEYVRTFSESVYRDA